jgi:hypothetical protein
MDFKGDKIRNTPSFGGEVKPSVPCRGFTACKRTLRAWKDARRQNSAAMFLTSVSLDSLLDGRRIRNLRYIVWDTEIAALYKLQTGSHLHTRRRENLKYYLVSLIFFSVSETYNMNQRWKINLLCNHSSRLWPVNTLSEAGANIGIPLRTCGLKPPIMNVFLYFFYFLLFRSKYSPQLSVLKHPQSMFFP